MRKCGYSLTNGNEKAASVGGWKGGAMLVNHTLAENREMASEAPSDADWLRQVDAVETILAQLAGMTYADAIHVLHYVQTDLQRRAYVATVAA